MSEKMVQKKATKKRNILAAAQRLFLAKGVSKTSIADITQAANVGKGTFYLYFRDKEDLIDQLFYQIGRDIIDQAILYADEHRTDCFADTIVICVDWIITYFSEHIDILALVSHYCSWSLMERDLTSFDENPLQKDILLHMMDSPAAARYDPDELLKIIFIVMETCIAVCYSCLIKQVPDTLDNMKPVLYQTIHKIFE